MHQKIVYLFGSQARGQSTNNSDWDIDILISVIQKHLTDFDDYCAQLLKYLKI